MRPAKPKFDWLKRNRPKGLITYDTGQRFAEFDDKGKCRWYYRNGRVALEYHKPKGKLVKTTRLQGVCGNSVLLCAPFIGYIQGLTERCGGNLGIKYLSDFSCDDNDL